MALIHCKECDKEISDQAAACPACGAPIALPKKPSSLEELKKPVQTKQAIGLLVFALFISLVWAYSGHQDDLKKDMAGPASMEVPSPTKKVLPVADAPLSKTGLSPTDTKSLSGSETLTVGSKSAAITLLRSEDEKHFFSDQICVDERECYGVKKFDRFITSKYPDISKIKFSPSKDVAEDKEVFTYSKQDFRRALYFAKLIKLADGETLFDFLKNCSKDMSPLNSASIGFAAQGKSYISMQFFPVLKQRGSGEEFEMQILFDRIEDRIEARSPWFSTSILTKADFMDKHGLDCWK